MLLVIRNIILEKSKSDYAFIGDVVENKLQTLFIDELMSVYENKKATLNELYVFYNKFLDDYSRLFNDISKRNLEKSKNMLKKIYPRRYKHDGGEVRVANGNKLRLSTYGDGIFISVKDVNTNENVTININIPKKK